MGNKNTQQKIQNPWDQQTNRVNSAQQTRDTTTDLNSLQ